MASVKEGIAARRLARMRQGQNVAEVVTLRSDEEIKLYMVPLTEAEYLQTLEVISAMNVKDDLAGVTMKDRRQAQETLIRSIREPNDLTMRVYDEVEEMTEQLDVTDIDELIDRYNEMVANSSPRLDGIPVQELENLKKALVEMDLNALSGRAWYAFKRFLSEAMPTLQTDNSLGSISTTKSTTPSD